MRIFQASSKDLSRICHLVNLAYRGNEARKGWTFESDLIQGEKRTDEEDLNALFADPKAMFLLAEADDGVLHGLVFLRSEVDALYLGMLSVLPDLQGRGIGKSLMAAAKDHAKEQGLSRIRIQVVHLRAELIRWYEKLGFVFTGKSAPFAVPPAFGIPRQSLHFLEMVWELG